MPVDAMEKKLVIAAAGAIGLLYWWRSSRTGKSSPAKKSLGPLVFLGCYTEDAGHVDGKGEGIQACRLLPNGQLQALGAPQPAGQSPSFLCANREGTRLYAVNEMQTESTVTAFAIDRHSGGLQRLGSESTAGSAGCHVSITSSGRGSMGGMGGTGGNTVMCANYMSGTVCTFLTDKDKGIRPRSCLMQHPPGPAGPHELRQEGPHAHCIVQGTHPDHPERVYATDLGLDQVVCYSLDRRGRLHQVASTAAEPGSGPRHIAFAVGGGHAYVSNELNSTVSFYNHDAQGGLERLQDLSTLPAHWSMATPDKWLATPQPDPSLGVSHCAHIAVVEGDGDDNGGLVLVSNRGHDSLAVFARDARTGRLTPKGHCSTGGSIPRHFAVTPDRRFVLVANMLGDNVVTLVVDHTKQELQPTGASFQTNTPVAVVVVD